MVIIRRYVVYIVDYIDVKNYRDRMRDTLHIFKEEIINEFTSREFGKEYG